MKTKVLIFPSIALIIVSAFCHFLYLNWPYPDKLEIAFEILCWLIFATGVLVFIPARKTSVSFLSISISILIAGAIWFVSYFVVLKFIGPLVGL